MIESENPMPSPLFTALAAQKQAERIASAAQTALAHAETLVAAAREAQAHAEVIADALQTSELRYRRLFEAARDGILILDSETGQVTDANPFMAELLDYKREDFLGKELWEIGLLKDKETSQTAFRQLQRDKYIRYEGIPLETRNGERREVEFVSNIYRENGHTVIQCNIRDITVRKSTENLRAAAAAKTSHIAKTLQRSMLQARPGGAFDNLEVESVYVPAVKDLDIGGDFFDAFTCCEGRIALLVGDVSGKGLHAAARTAEVKYALRAFLHNDQSPDVALQQLNDFICESHRLDKVTDETFIILALAIIHIESGRVMLSAAGAEPTLVLRGDNSVEKIEVRSTPIGIDPGVSFGLASITLWSGDTIVMATDGITEARHEYEFLGTDGVARLAETAGSASTLLELRQNIYNGALEFAQGDFRDDVCMLLARWHDPNPVGGTLPNPGSR